MIRAALPGWNHDGPDALRVDGCEVWIGERERVGAAGLEVTERGLGQVGWKIAIVMVNMSRKDCRCVVVRYRIMCGDYGGRWRSYCCGNGRFGERPEAEQRRQLMEVHLDAAMGTKRE